MIGPRPRPEARREPGDVLERFRPGHRPELARGGRDGVLLGTAGVPGGPGSGVTAGSAAAPASGADARAGCRGQGGCAPTGTPPPPAAARVAAVRPATPQQVSDIVRVTVDDEVDTTTFRAIVTDIAEDLRR